MIWVYTDDLGRVLKPCKEEIRSKSLQNHIQVLFCMARKIRDSQQIELEYDNVRKLS
jgi:hypothetical protein